MNPNPTPQPRILKSGAIAHKFTKEDSAKGGMARTDKTLRRNILNARKAKMCRNCTLPCPFKNSNLQQNVDMKCTVPDSTYLTLRMASEKNVIVPKLTQLFAETEMAVKGKGTPRDQIQLARAAIQLAEYLEPKDLVMDVKGEVKISVDVVQSMFRPVPKPVTVIEVKKESEVKTHG